MEFTVKYLIMFLLLVALPTKANSEIDIGFINYKSFSASSLCDEKTASSLYFSSINTVQAEPYCSSKINETKNSINKGLLDLLLIRDNDTYDMEGIHKKTVFSSYISMVSKTNVTLKYLNYNKSKIAVTDVYIKNKIHSLYPNIEILLIPYSDSLSKIKENDISAVVFESIYEKNTRDKLPSYVIHKIKAIPMISYVLISKNEALLGSVFKSITAINANIDDDGIKVFDNRFSERENDWLFANPILNIGVTGSNYPIEFIDEDGQIRGITIDLINSMSSKFDVNFDITNTDSIKDARNKLSENKISVISGVTCGLQDSVSLVCSPAYSLDRWVIAVNSERYDTNLIGDIFNKDLKVATINGGYGEILTNIYYPDSFVKLFDNLDDIMYAIVTNDIDVGIVSTNAVSRDLESKFLGKIAILNKDLSNLPQLVSFATDKDNVELSSIIVKMINSYSEYELGLVGDRWRTINFREKLTVDSGVIYLIAFLCFVLIAMLLSVIIGVRKRKKYPSLRDVETESIRKIESNIIDLLPEGVLIRNQKGMVINFNENLVNMFSGIDRHASGEDVNFELHQILNYDGRALMDSMFERILLGDSQQSELIKMDCGGKRSTILVTKSRISRCNSCNFEVLTTFKDVSEQMQKEGDAIEHHRIINYITNNFDGVLIQHKQLSSDPFDIEVLFVSDSIDRFCEIEVSNIISNAKLLKREICRRDDVEDILGSINSALDNGTFIYDLEINKEKEKTQWFQIRSQISKVDDHYIWNTLVIDITKIKYYEINIDETKKDALAAIETKSRFLAMMSHEIRTPLSGIISLIDLLKPYMKSKDATDIFESLNRSGENLLTIVNDVLDFSKLEAGKLKLENVETNLRTLILDLTQPHIIHMSSTGVMMNIYIDPNIASILLVDDLRIKQVLNNLVNNAIKFTEIGLITLKVELDSECDGYQSIVFSLSDTGIGIEEDFLQSLFTPFEQFDSNSDRRFGGTGLGLSVCQQIVNVMGGKISVTSKLGKGSEFSFSLSLQVCKPYNPAKLHTKCLVVNSSLKNDIALSSYLDFWGVNTLFVNAYCAEDVLTVVRSSNVDTVIVDDNWAKETNLSLVDEFSDLKLIKTTTRTLLSNEVSPSYVTISVNALNPELLYKCFTYDRDDMSQIASESYAVNPNKKIEIITRNESILVAEDHVINQKIIREQIKRLGYKVDVVSDGLLALRALENKQYALLITDCHMKNLDGYGLVKAIRQKEKKQSTDTRLPIVALTANALSGERERCLELGMDDFLTKPIRADHLATVIDKYISSTDSESTAHVRLIDIDELKEIFGSEEECIGLVNEYLSSTLLDFNDLQAANTEHDIDEFFMIVHKMKGASRMVEFNQLSTLLAYYEDIYSENGHIDMKESCIEISRQLEQLKLEIEGYE
ncbi:ATP-binding protein [Vibrio kasasachensis]|uniref:ATP-binding protein n=1 Tax=Vibrio kasasachensis TaxID=2910248 RepID=UPI003D126A93